MKLPIVDALGHVPPSPTGAGLPFEVFPRGYERAAIPVISNRPFEDRASGSGPERLTGALPDRQTHRVGILSLSTDGDRLESSRGRRGRGDGRAG